MLRRVAIEKYGIELPDLLKKMYWEEGKNQYEIAGELECSVSSICQWFAKLDIQVHPNGTLQRGRRLTDEHKAIISKTHKGKKLTKEQREKISAARKGVSPIGKSKRFQGKRHRKDGYVSLYLPDHPYATAEGYYAEHRFVMEKMIGRFLDPKEEVHHINHKRNDNRPENLHLFASKEEHMSHHMKERHAQRREAKCQSIV